MSAAIPLTFDRSRLPDLRATSARRQVEAWLARQELTLEELTTRNNTPDRVEARRVVAAFLRSEGWSLPSIGRFLERDHTTVMHLLRRGGSE